MKQPSIFNLILAVITVIMTGCNSQINGDKSFDGFSTTFTLDGKSITLPDSTLRILGKVDVCNNNYVYYVYQYPFFFTTSDKNFKNFRDFGAKGGGPGELQGAFPLGYSQEENKYSIYDYNAKKIYSVSLDSCLSLVETTSFLQNLNEFDPMRIKQLANGSFVGSRGDFRYGLISYTPATGKVEEWPLGGKFDNNNPVTDEVSMRVIGYNKEKGIVAEIYGCIPYIILHNEDGSILRRIRYTGYDKHISPSGDTADCFKDMVLTKKYLWLLYGDQEEMANSRVFCLDYDGNPIAELIIESTSTIAVDEKDHRLLAIDPNNDESNLVVYDLPEFLR